MSLNASSIAKLEGVRPELARVVRLAAERSAFVVTCGLRTAAQQRVLVAAGKSQTQNSRHLTGEAVDLAPLVDGKVSWDWKHFHPMAAVMKAAAAELGVAITWGGEWRTFPDGPHFELRRSP